MKVTMKSARAFPKIIIHRKVAAYCRVSTQQEIQLHSLEAQLCCAYTGRDSFNQCSPPSSRRQRRSSAPHLILRVPSARRAK